MGLLIPTSVYKGIPTTFTLRRGITVPRFVVLIALMVTEVRLCQNMKKIIVSLIFVLIAVCAYSQKDVTQFLGIPIDGSKSAMIQKLKAKGFRANSYNKDVLEGKFNGMDVNLHIATNNDLSLIHI